MYYIKDSTSTINATVNTGQLVTLEPLDRKERRNYMITLEARDNASPPFFLESRKNILIYIGDKNNNIPTSEGDISKHFVGYTPFIVQVSDLDSKSNADIAYAVAATNDSLCQLQIEQNNGLVIVRFRFSLCLKYLLQ